MRETTVLNSKILGACMLGLFFVFAISFLIPASYAEQLTYDEKIEFTTIIEEIKGHIIVATDNQHAGDHIMAKMHLTHPIGEQYENLENFYKKTSVSPMKLKMVLSLLQNTNTEINRENFDQLAEQITEVIESSKLKMVGSVVNDDEFKIQVAKNLLMISKAEYITGIEYDSKLELQDSYGITVSTNDLTSSLEDVKKHQQLKITKKFIELYRGYGDGATIEEMSVIFDTIIFELDQI